MGSSSLTGLNPGPLQWGHRVFATGPSEVCATLIILENLVHLNEYFIIKCCQVYNNNWCEMTCYNIYLPVAKCVIFGQVTNTTELVSSE